MITRDHAAHYLDSQFSSLAAAVDQADNSDGDSGYGADIDNALRQLGTSESDLASATVEDGDRAAYYALAKYYALDRFLTQLLDRVNTSTGRTSYNFTDQRERLEERLKAAARVCAALGYDVAPTAPTADIPASGRVKLQAAW